MKVVIKCYPQQYYIAIKQSNRHIESHRVDLSNPGTSRIYYLP